MTLVTQFHNLSCTDLELNKGLWAGRWQRRCDCERRVQ